MEALAAVGLVGCLVAVGFAVRWAASAGRACLDRWFLRNRPNLGDKP